VHFVCFSALRLCKYAIKSAWPDSCHRAACLLPSNMAFRQQTDEASKSATESESESVSASENLNPNPNPLLIVANLPKLALRMGTAGWRWNRNGNGSWKWEGLGDGHHAIGLIVGSCMSQVWTVALKIAGQVR